MIRRATTQSLLDPVNNLDESLLSNYRCRSQDATTHGRLDCDSLILGSLRKAMIKVRGGSLPDSADDIHESVQELASSLKKIFGQIRSLTTHDGCNPATTLTNLVKDTVNCRETVLTSDHRAFMCKQRQKTGLEGPQNESN